MRSISCHGTRLRATYAVVLASITIAGLLAISPIAEASVLPGNRVVNDGDVADARVPALPTTRQLACPCTLWSGGAVPAIVSQPDNAAVELGVKFRVNTPGFISGVRYYKSVENVGEHLGSLWAGGGQQLARAVFTNESTSGWQQVLFPAPIPVSPNTTYIVSYHTDVGFYSVNQDFFATAGFQVGPLRALATGEDGQNGVYRYGASAFPSDSFRSSNYWVDPIFTLDGADRVPPTLSALQVTETTTNAATIRWQTDEPTDARVEYGATTTYGGSQSDPAFTTSHMVRLTNLSPGTRYHVRAASRDASGNQGVSDDSTFTTAAEPGPGPSQPQPPGQPAPQPPGPSQPPATACQPRPSVAVSAVPSGAGRLLVTLTAGTSAGMPNNRLRAIRFLAGSNAQVDVGGQQGVTSELFVPLADGPPQASFYVRRVSAGQATTIPFIVTDDCGEFRSFAGGGAGAF
jgi:hypothetical protein